MRLSVLSLLLLVPGTLAQVTCDGLGDFNPDPPFDGWPDPTCPGDSTLDLSFTMYRSILGGESFDRSTVPTNFVSGEDTLFIVHGWNSDASSSWMSDMKNTIVGLGNMNAVIVGWGGSGGSQNLNYFESATTTRTVGAELAEVMMNLVSSGGGSASRMRCTGHSLGSHVCGHFGRRAAGNGQRPGRVTGMDPAGPNFASNEDRTVGIWTDSGDFVDIIHTDRSLGSTPEPGGTALTLGHQDFFPNNGNEQPGCGSDSCSHSRVHQLFIHSIDNDCFEATEECTASNELPGSCSSITGGPHMGFPATAGATGIFTMTTGSGGLLDPYC